MCVTLQSKTKIDNKKLIFTIKKTLYLSQTLNISEKFLNQANQNNMAHGCLFL